MTASVRDQVERLVLTGAPAPIVQVGHPVLRAVAEPYVGQLGEELLDALIETMRVTMQAAPGVGLAAPQIGIALAIAVAEDAGTVEAEGEAEGDDARERTPLAFRALVNPSYEPLGTERRSFYEGCLSVGGWQAVVARHRTVRLRCLDVRGRVVEEVLTGWPARIIQHETDHLTGRLYLDLAELRSLSSVGNLVEYWAGEGSPLAASRTLGFPLA